MKNTELKELFAMAHEMTRTWYEDEKNRGTLTYRDIFGITLKTVYKYDRITTAAAAELIQDGKNNEFYKRCEKSINTAINYRLKKAHAGKDNNAVIEELMQNKSELKADVIIYVLDKLNAPTEKTLATPLFFLLSNGADAAINRIIRAEKKHAHALSLEAMQDEEQKTVIDIEAHAIAQAAPNPYRGIEEADRIERAIEKIAPAYKEDAKRYIIGLKNGLKPNQIAKKCNCYNDGKINYTRLRRINNAIVNALNIDK